MKFSQRMGYTPAEKAIQVESIDDDLKHSLWNVLTLLYWDKYDGSMYGGMGVGRTDYIRDSNMEVLFGSIWIHFFKMPFDQMPKMYFEKDGGLEYVRYFFYSAEWFHVLDFIEYISKQNQFDPEEFREVCNTIFERENSAYRFVDKELVPISSSDEVEEIEKALSNTEDKYGTKEHLNKALDHLSDRQAPDFRNSIKESISAVESLCRSITGNNKATLGDLLAQLEKEKRLHPALKKAFSALYGYTSDESGIRHGLTDKSELTVYDARYILITCSAFINYVIATIK